MLTTLIFKNGSSDYQVKKGPDCQDIAEFKDEQKKYSVLSYGNNHTLSTVYTLYLCDSKDVQDTILSREHPERIDAFFEGIVSDLIVKNI
jgi:hypothetical protein